MCRVGDFRSIEEADAAMRRLKAVSYTHLGFPVIATVSGGAPMLGFLGTVTGMVRAFWEMANAGNNIDITLLSGGIYEAMITTVGGLIAVSYTHLGENISDTY